MEKQGIIVFNCPNCGAAIPPDSTVCEYCRSAITSRVCAKCYGSISGGMTQCPHCGAKAAETAPEKTGSFRCPRCHTKLAPISIGKHELNECTQCGGLWVDKNDFQEICTKEEEQESVLQFNIAPINTSTIPEDKPTRAYIPCPQCGKLMSQKNFSGCSGIVLDWCRDHGSWFDRSELLQVVQFIRKGGLHKAREREIEKLKQEETRLKMQQFEMASLERRLPSGEPEEHPFHDDPLVQIFSKLFSS
jgi:Zn-finger nucleic acid-binding protein